jgi:hypothetical protein
LKEIRGGKMNGNEHLVLECKKMEEDALYTAETHFQMAYNHKQVSFWVRFIPALVTGISGTLIILGFPNWVGWLSIIGAIAIAFGNIQGAERSMKEHTEIAKKFKTIQHTARYLYKTKQYLISVEEFFEEVDSLRKETNELILVAPQTSDKYFYKARKKIKEGIHIPDFEENE